MPFVQSFKWRETRHHQSSSHFIEHCHHVNMITKLSFAFLAASASLLWNAARSEVALEFEVDLKDAFDNETYRESFVHLPDFILDNSKTFLKEMSFCADFMPSFLLQQTLVSVGNVFTVTLVNLQDGLIRLMFDQLEYLVHVTEDIIPKQWHRMCLAFRENEELDVVFDGTVLVNDLKVVKPINLSVAAMEAAGLTLGYYNPEKYAYKELRRNKFHGMMHGVYLFSKDLKQSDMIDITSRNSCMEAKEMGTPPDLFDWTATNFETTSMVTVTTVNLKDEICAEKGLPVAAIYPIEASFAESKMFCKSLGGKLVVPRDQDHFDLISKIQFLDQKDTLAECEYMAWIGIAKDTGTNWKNQSYVNVNNASETVDYLNFPLDQPNGRGFEDCMVFNNESDNKLGFHDEYCMAARCTLCELDLEYTRIKIRGTVDIPGQLDIDRNYTCDNTTGQGIVKFIGFMNTVIYWDAPALKWIMKLLYVGHTEELGHTLKDRHPLGLTTWNITGQSFDLKMSQCKEDEFTCHLYGDCIPIYQRCNGMYDCVDGDMSDEEACNIVNLNEHTYNKEKPPRGPDNQEIQVNISLRLDRITKIDELAQTIKIKLRIEMTWYDGQLTFNNLRSNVANNKVDEHTEAYLWIPNLIIRHSEKLASTLVDKTTVLSVMRLGNHSFNAVGELFENKLYKGRENPLVMARGYTLTLHCSFDLAMFPFDMQYCPISMRVPDHLYPHMNITLTGIRARYEDIDLVQYDFIGFDLIDILNETKKGKEFIVNMKLRRIFIYHLAATYTPTLCLVIISELTIFIDEKHFEATIMVALTAMLVMYTLFQSVGDTLPQTSYLKMIDIWLLTGLFIPFFCILILIAMDSKSDDNAVHTWGGKDIKSDRKSSKKSRLISWIRIIVPLLTVFLVAAYFIAAARQFNLHH